MTNQKSILIRLTQDQHAQVQARAKAAGMSVNAYAVKAMLSQSPVVTPDEAIRGAEAALERALAALRSPAPVQTETAQEVTETPVEDVVEATVETVVETPAQSPAPASVISESPPPAPGTPWRKVHLPPGVSEGDVAWVKNVKEIDPQKVGGYAIIGPWTKIGGLVGAEDQLYVLVTKSGIMHAGRVRPDGYRTGILSWGGTVPAWETDKRAALGHLIAYADLGDMTGIRPYAPVADASDQTVDLDSVMV